MRIITRNFACFYFSYCPIVLFICYYPWLIDLRKRIYLLEHNKEWRWKPSANKDNTTTNMKLIVLNVTFLKFGKTNTSYVILCKVWKRPQSLINDRYKSTSNRENSHLSWSCLPTEIFLLYFSNSLKLMIIFTWSWNWFHFHFHMNARKFVFM